MGKHNQKKDRRGNKGASRAACRRVTRREMTQQERRKRRGLEVNEEAVP